MDKLSTEQLKQLTSLAGIRVHPGLKTVNFYGESYTTNGFDIIDDGEVVSTYVVIKGETRAIYPEGGEYMHSSIQGLECTYATILRVAARSALLKLAEAV